MTVSVAAEQVPEAGAQEAKPPHEATVFLPPLIITIVPPVQKKSRKETLREVTGFERRDMVANDPRRASKSTLVPALQSNNESDSSGSISFGTSKVF
mmetsp:Transcript_16187/g.44561  ORF Transcript_16187/g.44561 Transcript_16187/m.44561 type:complete len:97 (+) Transcript_16187:883-1173(+)